MTRSIHTTAVMLMAINAASVSAQEMIPGQWEITSSILSVEGPMVTPQVRAATLKNGQRNYKACLTAQQLKEAPTNVSQRFNGTCKPADTNMADGKISSSMRCTLPNGTSVADSTGTYSAKAYRVETRAVTTIAQGGLTAHSVVNGAYLGPCR